ncbi:MAG: hypothetical protein ACMXYC_02165 [Candidatus Woesearchaeota archaeon]
MIKHHSIVPSIIAKTPSELQQRVQHVIPYVQAIQLDIMDGKFVSEQSCWFDVQRPDVAYCEAHMMVADPLTFIKAHKDMFDCFIIHQESVDDSVLHICIDVARQYNKRVGIALNPQTPVEHIQAYMQRIDMILFMSVQPGFYGARFVQSVVQKIANFAPHNPGLILACDGGINDATISALYKAGIRQFCVGSYLQDNQIAERIQILKQAMK